MWIVIIVLVLVIAAAAVFEYRMRKPDQLILRESNGKIECGRSLYYPRHFRLAIQNTTHSSILNVEASAKGNLEIKIKLSVTVAASAENLAALIRVGGWKSSTVIKAASELETIFQSLVKEFAEKYELEELSSEKISNYLHERINIGREKFGLDIISLTVQSFEAADSKISESIRQRESARILEQTELLSQKARINATKAKLKADEEIARMETELALKRSDLKKEELEKESVLAHKRMEEELKRNKLRLEFDKEELELLKGSPELLMLTPQAARLAEAGQALKNAKTVISLSPNEIAPVPEMILMFSKFLQNALDKTPSVKE